MAIPSGGNRFALPIVGKPFKLISAGSTNSTLVKAGEGDLFAIWVSNINAAICYLKLYDKVSAPTVGTDVPVLTLGICGNAAGAGGSISLPGGLHFATGIGIGLTTAPADNSVAAVAASEVVVALVYF